MVPRLSGSCRAAAGQSISLWDRRKFPCARADSMVAYPTDTEVRRSILLFMGG